MMPTLCVKNVPDDLYGVLQRQAKQNHRSIAAAFLELLKIHLAVHSDRFLHPQLLKRETRSGPASRRLSH
jgi:plasmid stability protein